MKINKNIIISCICGVLLGVTACNEYLDINTDPNNPTVAPLDQLTSKIQKDAADTYNSGDNWMANFLGVFTHQIVVREESDQYGLSTGSGFITNSWSNLYLTNTNLNSLISTATDQGNMVYAGIGKIIQVDAFTKAVDIWGDLPYSEASKLGEAIIAPNFDDQVQIYTALFALLDEAIANLNDETAENSITPGEDDLIYGGDVDMWIKAANTLKLKMYNNVRLYPALFDETAVNALISGGNLISSIDEDFEFEYSSALAPVDERHPLFAAEYGGGQITQYISPWFYEIMMGVNPTAYFTTVEDPRIPYYWFNQLTGGELAQNPIDYHDPTTDFVSIRFGSIGDGRDSGQRGSATVVGMYICGGRYDDGMGSPDGDIGTSDGTGIAPFQYINYYERLFIEAELIQAGVVTGDASAKLREAIVAAFAKVDDIVENNQSTQTIPELSGTTEVTAYIDNVITLFDAATADQKMEIIMTQKWIASFGKFADQYNDIRRTGYPVLANPNGTNEYQIDAGQNSDGAQGDPLLDSETTLGRDYPLSIFWPASEINTNSNAPDQKLQATYSIFWDN